MNIFKFFEVFTQRPQQSGNPLETYFNKTLIIDGKPRIHHTVDPFQGLTTENRVIRLKQENKFVKA